MPPVLELNPETRPPVVPPECVDVKKKEVAALLADRQEWIAPSLERQKERGFQAHDASVELFETETEKYGVVMIDGIDVYRADEQNTFGAKAAIDRKLLKLDYDTAKQLQSQFDLVDITFKSYHGTPFERSILTFARETYPQAGFDDISQITPEHMRTLVRRQKTALAEAFITPYLVETTAIDINYGGFGHSIQSLTKIARETMHVWSNGETGKIDTHRMMVIVGYMGSEKVRTTDTHGRVFDYDLETHGPAQIKDAVLQTQRWMQGKKTEMARYGLCADLREVTINGHSMGGYTAIMLASEAPDIRKQIHAISPSVSRLFFMANTPVTVGWNEDHTAVTLLDGPYGSLLQLGAAVVPEVSMPIANTVNLVKLVHSHYMPEGDRVLEPLAAHLALAELDPLYIVQCTRSLKKAPALTRILTPEQRKNISDLTHRGELVSLVSEEDVILFSKAQERDLMELRIPILTMHTPHYHDLYDTVRAIQTGDTDGYITYVAKTIADVQEIENSVTNYRSWQEKMDEYDARIRMINQGIGRRKKHQQTIHEAHTVFRPIQELIYQAHRYDTDTLDMLRKKQLLKHMKKAQASSQKAKIAFERTTQRALLENGMMFLRSDEIGDEFSWLRETGPTHDIFHTKLLEGLGSTQKIEQDSVRRRCMIVAQRYHAIVAPLPGIDQNAVSMKAQEELAKKYQVAGLPPELITTMNGTLISKNLYTIHGRTQFLEDIATTLRTIESPSPELRELIVYIEGHRGKTQSTAGSRDILTDIMVQTQRYFLPNGHWRDDL
jgi:pimeloyl-ACP methyl ester carboxylesterase